jgi:hypothetical protein
MLVRHSLSTVLCASAQFGVASLPPRSAAAINDAPHARTLQTGVFIHFGSVTYAEISFINCPPRKALSRAPFDRSAFSRSSRTPSNLLQKYQLRIDLNNKNIKINPIFT